MLVYYAFKFFSRYIAPIFLKKVIDNVEKKYKAQQKQQNHRQDENVKVGETVIDRKPSVKKESNKDVGEYVDYEELND